jgi:hypothetical protein
MSTIIYPPEYEQSRAERVAAAADNPAWRQPVFGAILGKLADNRRARNNP